MRLHRWKTSDMSTFPRRKNTKKTRKPQITIVIDQYDMVWNSRSLPWNMEHGSLSVSFHPIKLPNGFLSWCTLAHSVKTCRLGEITPHGLDFAAAPVIRIVEPQKKCELKVGSMEKTSACSILLSCAIHFYLCLVYSRSKTSKNHPDFSKWKLATLVFDMTAVHFDLSHPRPTGVHRRDAMQHWRPRQWRAQLHRGSFPQSNLHGHEQHRLHQDDALESYVENVLYHFI